MQILPGLLSVSKLKITPICLAFFIIVPNAFAVPLNTLDVWVADDNGWPIDETRTSNTDAVSYDSTPGDPLPQLTMGPPFGNDGEVSGFAGFGVLRAQAYASSSGGTFSSPTHRQASTDAETFYHLTVGGGPGLAPGESVSINLSFRLDGYLNTGAATGDTNGWASFGAELLVIDQDLGFDCLGEGGCIYPELLDFRANGLSQRSGVTETTYNEWRWSLETENSLGELIDTDTQGDNAQWDVGPGAVCLPAPINNYCINDINFDTGILSVDIDTTVGAILDISASLGLFSQATDYAGGGAYGSGNFLDTFGLLFTPITEGVELSYGDITPAFYDLGGGLGGGDGSTSVPEPATLALMAFGLAGLGFSRRKKRG